MTLVEKYFPDLTLRQREQFAMLGALYGDWNARINVVSRRDMAEFEVRHVLHSLAIARVLQAGAVDILDVGTGGGFPAVPLAILFPDAHVTAVDSIGKKIRVVEQVAGALELDNLTALNARAESVPGRFDWVVSRAVAPARTLLDWTADRATRGWIFLKGGDLTEELAQAGRPHTLYNISEMFAEPFFETKKVVIFDS